MHKNNNITISVFTWFRESTKEWIGEIIYQTENCNGNARYTGATENEARNAAFVAIGYHLLQTTFD